MGSEAHIRRKLEALDNTALASQQRQAGVERTVAELRAEVQNLRSELAANAAANATAANATPMSGTSPPVATCSTEEDAEAAIWATNKQLQAKVQTLQEELQTRRNRIRELRETANSN